ncbi:PA14 domain-containing protein [Nostoc sp.]|uniref:PA14 domain-containing protein n=1 Tax=Nostoc sp. TaxID=1180 RepID=UPI002FFCC26B
MQPAAINSSANSFVAEYFNNSNLSGLPSLKQYEESLVKDWGSSSPYPSIINSDDFSTRWTGKIQPPRDGDYTFSITTADNYDGVRLYLNDQLLLDKWNTGPGSDPVSITQRLQSSQTYTLKVEYIDRADNARLTVLWSGPGLGDSPQPVYPVNTLGSPTTVSLTTNNQSTPTNTNDKNPGVQLGVNVQLQDGSTKDGQLSLTELQNDPTNPATTSLSGKAKVSLSGKSSFSGSLGYYFPSLGADIAFGFDQLSDPTNYTLSPKFYPGSTLGWVIKFFQGLDSILKYPRPALSFLTQDTKLYPTFARMGIAKQFDVDGDFAISALELFIAADIFREKIQNGKSISAEDIKQKYGGMVDTVGYLSLLSTVVNLVANQFPQIIEKILAADSKPQASDNVSSVFERNPGFGGAFNQSSKIDYRHNTSLKNAIQAGASNKQIATRLLAGLGDDETVRYLKDKINQLFRIKGFGLPILTDPRELIKLLDGKDATLIDFLLPKARFDTEYLFPIPFVIGVIPAALFLRVGLLADLNLGGGFDTRGIKDWAKSGYALDQILSLLSGLFLYDVDPLTKVDLPEIKVEGSLAGGAYVGVSVANIGGQAGIKATANIDLVDGKLFEARNPGTRVNPDKDGKIRLDEVSYGFQNFPDNLGKLFDLKADVSVFANFFANLVVTSETFPKPALSYKLLEFKDRKLFFLGNEVKPSASGVAAARSRAVLLSTNALNARDFGEAGEVSALSSATPSVNALNVEDVSLSNATADVSDTIFAPQEISLDFNQRTYSYTGAIGDNIASEIAPGKDVDIFQVLVHEGDTLNFQVSSTVANLIVRVFNEQAREVAFQPISTGSAFSFAVPETGIYYVGISNQDSDKYLPWIPDSGLAAGITGDYTLDVNLVPNSVEMTTNDNLETASAIALNIGETIIYQGALGDNPAESQNQDVDMLQVFLQLNENLQLKFTNTEITDLTLRIFDEEGEEIPVDLHDDQFNFLAPRTGTYYIGVGTNDSYDPTTTNSDSNIPLLGSLGDYNLSLTRTAATPEVVNDRFASAITSSIPLVGQNRLLLEGAIGDNPTLDDPDLDVDYYKLDLQADKTVTIRLDASIIGSQLDAFLRLFDDQGNLVATDIDPEINLDDLNDYEYKAVTEGDAYLTFTPDTTSTYYLAVSNYAQRFSSPNDPLVSDNPYAEYLEFDDSFDDQDVEGDTLNTAQQVVFQNNQFYVEGAIGDNFTVLPGQDVDLWGITLLKGQALVVDIDSYPIDDSDNQTYEDDNGDGFDDTTTDTDNQQLAVDFDPFLRVFDAQGNPIGFSDDRPSPLENTEDSGEDYQPQDPYLTFVAPEDGVYYVGLSTYEASNYHPNQAGRGLNSGSTGYYTAKWDLLPNGLTEEFKGVPEINHREFTGAYELDIRPNPLENAINAGLTATQLSSTQTLTFDQYVSVELFPGEVIRVATTQSLDSPAVLELLDAEGFVILST